MVDPTPATAPSVASDADAPSSPGAKWTQVGSHKHHHRNHNNHGNAASTNSAPSPGPRWGGNRGGVRGTRGGSGSGRGRGGAANRGDGKSHSAHFARPATATPAGANAAAAKPRGREPVQKRTPPVSRKASIVSASSAAADDSGDSSDSDASGRSPSPPPPAVPLTFWTPLVFLCPMPDCPPTTEPTTNPTVALDHLRDAHSLEVKNAHHVLPYLDKYIEHYAKLVAEKGVDAVAHKIDSKESDAPAASYILGHDSDLADKSFREKLQREKLNQMLKIQEKERLEDPSHPRKCLFCKVQCPNRTLLFKHMFSEHGFNIGLPDNLVEVSDFLETLQKKLAGLQCLYCEKIFKTSAVLRKHMRKKKHFKINPRNRGYDRFYIINYLEPGKNWEAFENEKYESDEDRKEEEWEDWNEDDDSLASSTMCLFDELVFPTALAAHEHMCSAHAFDLRKIRDERNLDFYGSIRLINFIRKQTSYCSCYSCRKAFDTIEEMTAHMEAEKHFHGVPAEDADMWSDPQYLFPCYENDPLLMFDMTPEDQDDDEQAPADAAEAESELRRIAVAQREKAADHERLAAICAAAAADAAATAGGETSDGEVSPCESDVIVVGVKEVRLEDNEAEKDAEGKEDTE
ncbi:hypothetical protein HDU87_006724 [Geranomyces variabilis]|uniref:C2H2-type domain-containing protein n=1 Tax=Geranomyces variabilis TaxID=109894 RepID=A0AAD5TUL0_9FUNG|nr:hypothetical protein HDU87_006724 [Geranomyces variabilis]